MPRAWMPACLVRDDGEGGVDAERRVVIQGVVDLGPVVHHLVALGAEVADQVGAELHAGVVGGDVHAREVRWGHGDPFGRGGRLAVGLPGGSGRLQAY